MNQQEKIDALLAMHRPEAQQDAMVWEVWNDAEVTLTKGGDLYGQRNLHMTLQGDAQDALPADALVKRFQHSRIMVRSREEANRAVEIIRGKCPYHSVWI